MKQFTKLTILFFLTISVCAAQNTWGESLSIVNPISLNGVEIYSFSQKNIIEILGEPKSVEDSWSEYDDAMLVIYEYENSQFYFFKKGGINYMAINDERINGKVLSINGHSVGGSLNYLRRDFPKSVNNMIGNEVSMHLMHNLCITTDIITFEIENEIIKSIQFQNLH